MEDSPSTEMHAPEGPSPDTRKPQRIRLLAVLVTGVYAWSLTVLPLLGDASDTPLVGLFGWAAIVVLAASFFLPPGRWSMLAALDGFVGACVLAWWAARNTQIDPPSAVFGSFGWLAYTLALGALSTPVEHAKVPLIARDLEPRTRPSRSAILALLVSLLMALFLLGRAWTVERPAQLVLAHVLVLAAALLVLRSGAGLATYLQVRDTKMAASPQLKTAIIPLMFFFSLVAAGLFWR